jgi:hypothetical protein
MANNLAEHVLQFYRIYLIYHNVWIRHSGGTPFVTGCGSFEYLDLRERMLLEVGENYTMRGVIITVCNKYY